MSNPKVSIIVPVYNVENYLERCIESLRNQTLENIEIILVDDASSDSSPHICDKAAAEDSRIKVIHKVNEGAGKARNAALKIAKGEYIGFVDSDDFVDPHMFDILSQKMEEYNSDLVMSGVRYIGGKVFENSGECEEKFYFDKDTQFETNEEVVINCVNHAVKNGITTVIDCGPAKNFALEKMQGATILSPNESETKALTGIYPDNEENILNASKILEERSKAKYIILKLGERGSALWNGEKLKLFPPYKSNVVDTTAAGDCFTAALALEYIRSGDIEKACDFGNKAGSIAVSRMGAQSSMPTIQEILNI